MIKNGFILPLIVFIPNLVFVLFPPKKVPPLLEDRSILKVMTWLERLGQASVLIFPFLYSINLGTSYQWLGFCVLVISIVIYYIGWLRYLLGGRNFELLFVPMLGMPIPMAISPVIYFFAGAIVLSSWPLFIGTILLALGHLSVSYNTYVQIIG